MKLAAPALVLTLLAASAVPALACTPSGNQAQIEKAYYRSVTSVYRVVAEEFAPADPRYPMDNFSVRLKPVETVWGERAPEPFILTFTPGMCNGWFLEDLSPGETMNGREYFVFSAPPGQQRLSELHVMPTDGQPSVAALVLLGRLQTTGSTAPSPEDRSLPAWPPVDVVDASRPAPARAVISLLPWLLGSAVTLFLIGLGVGRASSGTRRKKTQSST
ncbi:MAG: hypothetical protein EBR82_13795 [Caulobacteraceae bacterium]|nr:hypothetical protein [Caulobacteraceae bacterium]